MFTLNVNDLCFCLKVLFKSYFIPKPTVMLYGANKPANFTFEFSSKLLSI